MNGPLIECVPNFSEGRDTVIIEKIAQSIRAVEGVKLLNVDPGKATNRTVMTFVGAPEPVIEAAFQAIKTAAQLIDMSKHKGEHPRMGATDVCPLVPIANISMEEVVKFAHKLGERVGRELGIPGYYYEYAASAPERKNLATVRAGEYEGLAKKLTDKNWAPDFGPAEFAKAKTTGATAISARDFLVAYNINLNTTSTRRANAIAFDIRETGRVKRIGDPVTGQVVNDENGNPVYIPGKLKAVKGIGWFIDEYGIAQISYNLTNINITPVHIAFDETCKAAEERGMRVTGSELIGLVPKQSLVDAGKYFLRKQERSTGIPEEEIIRIAIKSLGLDELAPFNPRERVIEYLIEDQSSAPLVKMSLKAFAEETSAESPAPGGGSISAYVGALGVSLGAMVANLSAHKRGWDERWEEFSNWAEKGMHYQAELLKMVDEDTHAFNRILESFQLPQGNDEEKKARSAAIQEATRGAILVPMKVMELSYASMEVMRAMVEIGNPNSVTDAAVGALCARTAVRGAQMNVLINMKGFKDQAFVDEMKQKADSIATKAEALELEILRISQGKM
jgi:glutamate formiminotransferase/formiminotetrahydrofolate cyclodeaminase